MHYYYTKKVPRVQARTVASKPLSIFFFFTGLVLLGSAIGPIFFYQFFVSPKFSGMVKPIQEDTVLGKEQEVRPDLIKASNWFPQAPQLPPLPSKITHYTLSIPKLKIEDAVVEINGEDLYRALVQYAGVAFPGQFGNTVIFGHSVLPQFFNSKNYKTIFSTLPTLKMEDEVMVNFDGVRYTYVVEEMIEVKPEDISILEQKYDDSYLTLVTCVPPGTLARRLAVKARLKAV